MTVPILQSLLLADHIYRDQMTGKHIICGVFSTIYFTPNPPTRHPAAGPQPTTVPHEPSGSSFVGMGIPSPNAGHSGSHSNVPGENVVGGTVPVAPSAGGVSDGGPSAAGGAPDDAPHSGSHDPVHHGHQRQQQIQQLMQAGSPYVYFSITELVGRKMFEVRYVDLKENRMLFQTELPIECRDPLQTIEVTLPLPRLPLVNWEERSYGLEVVCEGQLLGTYRVLARITPGTNPPANS